MYAALWLGAAQYDANGFVGLIGLIGGVAQIFLTLSYRFAPASVVAPFEYTAMLFSLLIGYVFFNELPTLQMLIGAGIIIMAGLVIILREAQLGLKRGAAKLSNRPLKDLVNISKHRRGQKVASIPSQGEWAVAFPAVLDARKPVRRRSPNR